MCAALSEAAKTQSPLSYLYTRIAASHLGDTAAIIISTLISYGRLTAKELSTKSSLTQKQVRTALVSLIQLGCISYWATPPRGPVHYSFNDAGIQVLLHAGDIITRIKNVYGEEEAEVVQHIIENGHIAVKDYVASFADADTQHTKMTLLVKLYNDGWLRRLQPVDFQPLEDCWNRLYQETLKNTPRTTTTSEVKRVAEAKEKTKTKFADLFAAGTDVKDVFYVENGIHKLRPHITVQINFARYEKYLRSRALVDLANLRLGLITLQIYAVCCALIEHKAPDLHDKYLQISNLVTDPEEARMYLQSIENRLLDSKVTVFHIRDVVRMLPANLDLRNSILTQNFLKPAKRINMNGTEQPLKKVKLEDGVVELNGDDDLDHDDDNSSPHSLSLVAQHMKLLTASNVSFLYEVSPGSYTIPFLQLSRAVKEHHYDALIKTTMGANALRVLKCIKEQKLVDEKAISNLVLLKEKTVKHEVYNLLTNNVIEVQEVPRSADRAASKTFFLFRHKGTASFRYLAHSLAYSMGEILSNLVQFRLEHKILLEKCDREDVKGHEEELLLELELKTLQELHSREISNTGRFNRLKWLYFVFGGDNARPAPV